MICINIFGGPGSGKSTAAAGVFYKMKLSNIKVELVTEFAKQLVWENRLKDMQTQQEAMFAEQNYRMHILRGKVDYLITDSPLLLSNIYSDMNHAKKGFPKWTAQKDFKKFVISVFKTYENTNILLKRPDVFEEYGRIQNLEESIHIDNNIEMTLDEIGAQYTIVLADKDVVKNILSAVAHHSDR
jgi:adenylate kinase family enzyme